MIRRARAAALLGALAASAALGACDLVLGVPDRDLDPHLVCTSGACTCAAGFADCDGKPETGCEAALQTDAENCGACGHACQNGVCNAGTCACKPHFADCDGNLENGCEASIETDPKNCGACGRDCLGASCQGGYCEPIQVTSLTQVNGIQIVNGSLYVGGKGTPASIVEIPTGGGQPVPLVPASAPPVDYMTVVGSSIFWSYTDKNGQQNVVMSPLGKVTSPVTLQTNTANANLAATSSLVYWYDDGLTFLQRLPVTGGTPEEVFVGLCVDTLAVDQDNAYFSDGLSLYSVPHTSKTVKKLGDYQVDSLIVDGKNLLFEAGTNLVSLPVAGGKATRIAHIDFATALAVDATTIYWADATGGSVKKIPRGGGTPVELLVGQKIGYAPIAVDAQWVYFSGGADLALLKVAK